MQEQEEGNDQNKAAFEIEEIVEPTPTVGQRIRASLKSLKSYLADLFVNFVILPNSKLMLIKYFNCLFVFATTLTITYMVSQRTCSEVRLPIAAREKSPRSPLDLSPVERKVDLTHGRGEHRAIIALTDNLVFEVWN